MPPTPALPTTQEIRDAIAVIHAGVHDPYADPTPIAAAHRLLVAARQSATSPVCDWLTAYLDKDTTAHGPNTFRHAVDTLAQHFKLPPATPPPAPGEQGTLFD